jgi:hypothetical protein
MWRGGEGRRCLHQYQRQDVTVAAPLHPAPLVAWNPPLLSLLFTFYSTVSHPLSGLPLMGQSLTG